VWLLYLYGDNSTHFDSIYIGALGLSCVFCWQDKDTLGALFILLAYWVSSKILINVPDEWPYWLLIYGGSATVCWYYFHNFAAKLAFIIVLYSVLAEGVWWFQEYADKPEVHYYVGLLTVTVWIRQLLFNRIFIADKYFNYTSGKTGLDTHARGILYLDFVVILAMTVEYFVRHLGGVSDASTVYYLYSPLTQVISGMTLAAIYMHYFNNQSKKYLSA
jgi:hypothetical protein